MKTLALLSSAALLLGCSILPSCTHEPEPGKKPKKKIESAKPKLVGRIASIPSDRKFVLIQSYGTWNVETGAVLTTTGPEGRAANLRVTGEKLGQFAAADIRSGQLEIGDGVYTSVASPRYVVVNPGEAKPTAEPEAADDGNAEE